MANWLEKLIPPAPPGQAGRRLPVKLGQGRSSRPGSPLEGIPNAALIYGIAASALIVIALYLVFQGRWVTGLLVLLPAGCFLGYALHFVKHPD